MTSFFLRCFIISTTLFIVVGIVSIWIDSTYLHHFLSLNGLLSLASALLTLRGKSVFLPLLLIMFSFLIVITDISNIHIIWQGFRQMSTLVIMILVIPMIGWVLREDEYLHSILALNRKRMQSNGKFFVGIMIITQALSYFLLVGVVALMHQFKTSLVPQEKLDRYWDNYFVTAIGRSFALHTLWIINVPSFAYIVYVYNASLIKTVVHGFILTVLGLVLAFLFFKYCNNNVVRDLNIHNLISQSQLQRGTKADNKRHKQLAIHFMIMFASFLSLILILNAYVSWGMLNVITISIIIWTVAYYVYRRAVRKLFSHYNDYIRNVLPTKRREVSLYIAAGILATTINYTGWGTISIKKVYELTANYIWLDVLWIVPLLMLSLGLLGISPSIAVVLLASIIVTLPIPYPNEMIALSFSLGSALTFLIAPLTVTTSYVSSVNGRSPLDNSFKINWLYALTFYIIAEIYIFAVSKLLAI